ncbi:MAG TPA: TIR domain-containing protein [Steroidobacteraceae bacterium]|jgi:TolB-like protein|nr:TIR domain-containing protein [Steroidobacteraceae bacterium]
MTEPAKAVFLSYASQDGEAARHIADALHAAGIEVWFDQSELRGGDAWDRQIRKQIHDCALFMPIISGTTQGRLEGYFRREWRLAVDRTHDMAEGKPFLVPVVIDDTKDQDAEVPDAFRRVQWSRLPAGSTPPAFIARVSQLLSPPLAHGPGQARLASPSATTVREPPPSRVASRATQRVLLTIAAVVVIGIGYLALDKFLLSKRPGSRVQSPAHIGQPAALAQSAIPEKSIAVLPFVDMSEKNDQAYFSDGLSEEMIDLLSQLQDLRVPARTSSFSFKGKSDDIPSIARKLRVAHVLEGSVRRAGNMVRVTVQLIRADSGYHLWSKTYDREFKDIFQVQDEIAAAVVEALKVKLGPTQPAAAHRSSNPEAYNQYLLGRQFHRRGNPDGWRRAIEAFHKANALDPHYAAAYASLALSEYVLADSAGDATGQRQAMADAERAVTLAPQEADGYVSRGVLRMNFGWDWSGAEADLEKALALDPTSDKVQGNYATLVERLGRLPEAVEVGRRATEIDPLSAIAWSNLGQYLTFHRDYPAAHEALRRCLEINPESSYGGHHLAILQLLEGNAVGGLATARKVGIEFFRLTDVAMAEHSLGHVKESQQALEELIARHALDGAYQVSEALAWRGEKDKAFEWLERAYQQRDGGLSEVKVDLLLDSLHGDRRFKALLRKLNLPE